MNGFVFFSSVFDYLKQAHFFHNYTQLGHRICFLHLQDKGWKPAFPSKRRWISTS